MTGRLVYWLDPTNSSVPEHLFLNPNMCRIEHQANLLWIPADSDYNTREDWLDINFKSKSRDEIILFSNENVLTPESMKEVRDTEIKS